MRPNLSFILVSAFTLGWSGGEALSAAPAKASTSQRAPRLAPVSFRITESRSARPGGTRYLAQASSNCTFEVVIAEPKPAPQSPFAFTALRLVRRPGDCSRFLRALAWALGFKGRLPSAAQAGELEASVAILGTNQSRSPQKPEVAGAFSSNPRGHWTAAKVFLADGEGEVFLNLNADEGVGEFSPKDEEYAEIVVRELAKIFLPNAG